MTKTCNKCGEVKPLSEFYKRGDRDAYRGACKACHGAKASARYKVDPEFRARQAARSRTAQLKKNYGVTPEDYDRMLEGQGGQCAICGTDNPGRGVSFFAVDHCHNTGEVRGLLCANCNKGLGHFFDNTDSLTNAITYLQASRR